MSNNPENMTEENITEMKPESESGVKNDVIPGDVIEQAIAEAVTPEKPKRKSRKRTTGTGMCSQLEPDGSRRKKTVTLEGETAPEAIGYCSECGHAVFKDDRECRGCGARFNDSSVDELVRCPHCGLTIDLEGFRGSFKCPSCGGGCYAED